MEVKPGYKQTEVGVIPEEWVVSLLADVITSFQNGFAFASHGYVKSGIPIVTMAQIGLDGRFNFTSESVNYWPTEAASALRAFQLFRGDIIIAMTDVTPQKNLIGRMAEVTEIGPLLLNQRVGLFRLDAKKIDPYFLRAMSNSSRWRGYARAVASLGVQANIGTNDIRAGKLPLPPLSEQRAIATALSDVDGLLGGLDRLIAKKHDLKQAAMQQLLTGQTRLPGFHGEWEVKRLRAIVQTPVTDGPHLTPQFFDDGIPFLSVNNLVGNRIDLTDLRFISQQDHEVFSRKCKPQRDDILLGKAASVGKVAIVELDCEFNIWSPIALIRVSTDHAARFIYYQLQSADLISQITLLTNSSSQGNIGMGDIEKLTLKLPPLPEQTAIASVLTEMDGEMAGLTQRREKTRALKQAMMQELLTGRTRLI